MCDTFWTGALVPEKLRHGFVGLRFAGLSLFSLSNGLPLTLYVHFHQVHLVNSWFPGEMGNPPPTAALYGVHLQERLPLSRSGNFKCLQECPKSLVTCSKRLGTTRAFLVKPSPLSALGIKSDYASHRIKKCFKVQAKSMYLPPRRNPAQVGAVDQRWHHHKLRHAVCTIDYH